MKRLAVAACATLCLAVSPATAEQGSFRLQEATVASIHDAFASGQLTCTQLTKLHLDRIDAYDRRPVSYGDVPTILYGFGFDLSYKGFTVGAFLQGQSHAQIYLDGSSIKPFSGDGGNGNAYSVITDRWTPENPKEHPFYPRLAYGGPKNANNDQFSSWWVRAKPSITCPQAAISSRSERTAAGSGALSFSWGRLGWARLVRLRDAGGEGEGSEEEDAVSHGASHGGVARGASRPQRSQDPPFSHPDTRTALR